MIQSSSAKRTGLQWLTRVWSRFGILAIFLLLFLAMGLLSDHFLSAYNLVNVARQITIVAISAVGMTFIILAGEIDLSAGSIAALAGVATAGALKAGLGLPLSLIIGLVGGVLCGAINGLVTTYGRIPSFIVTLGMTTVARGTVLVYTNAYPISGLPSSFGFIGKGYVGPVPTPVLLMLVIYLVAYYVLNWTIAGRSIYALGGNAEAARLSGINIKLSRVLTFVVAGAAFAMAGIVMTSRMLSGQPSSAVGMELDAIAATVIGGTSLSGGRGSIWGTLVGALIMGTISNGLDLLGVSSYWQMIAQGLIIVAAVLLDRIKE